MGSRGRRFRACVFQVKDLLWNCDSSVLAVWLEDLAAEDTPVDTRREEKSLMFPKHISKDERG